MMHFIALVSAYILGCFCSAYYVAKWWAGKNLREVGSSNLGATNAGRLLGKKGFLIVFFLDFLKGILAVGIARQLDFPSLFLIAIAVVIGHIWPMQLQFKGGKGVSTFLGALIAIDVRYAIPLIVLFFPPYFIFRKFAVSGLISIGLIPLSVWYLSDSWIDILLSIVLSGFVVFAGRDKFIELFRKSSG